jgi:hypothetical protein
MADQPFSTVKRLENFLSIKYFLPCFVSLEIVKNKERLYLIDPN